jgi:hypothetical protein
MLAQLDVCLIWAVLNFALQMSNFLLASDFLPGNRIQAHPE